ncbi:Mitochondrial import inner membrane translocase subunit TIM44-2 [Vitis vinifera]|uniref:Mitochondrial import inner membrane translocase subunit TIM44-2 n=1 Tax=Vitis vinifera TaxID=29760 RepID=A0A438CN73_VITVI|nr:Mitochondrial import inner membrane translocase subunit TIM44-2 [Vitis vinifera]
MENKEGEEDKEGREVLEAYSHIKFPVSANVKEKISAATEDVKETFGKGKQEFSESAGTSAKSEADSSVSTVSPKVSLAFEKLKEAKVLDLAKKGYGIVKDELSSNPSKRKQMQRAACSASPGERSTKTDIVIVPSKQSQWSKKWEALKDKASYPWLQLAWKTMQGHPVFKRISGLSEPVVTKGQELAEDVRERWETSDNPVVHKIQDLNESVFGETAAAMSFKEIRRRDPSFSLPDFVSEVQEVIRPVLNAYIKGDAETLKKYCSPEVIERCKAEHGAYQTMGIIFDNKILHISDVEVRETKMMGTSPIIIVADTIHTVYYAWAMQQVDAEELGEGAIYPIWRLREMQQLGVQALI